MKAQKRVSKIESALLDVLRKDKVLAEKVGVHCYDMAMDAERLGNWEKAHGDDDMAAYFAARAECYHGVARGLLNI